MKKIKFKRVIIFLLILLLIGLIIYYVFNKRIENIFIYNNIIVSDQEVIDSSNLRNYPKYFLRNSITIKKDLLRNSFIKDVTIKKTKFKEIHLYIEEYKPLFIYNDKVILENKKEIYLNISVPILINEINNEYYDLFIDKMLLVDDKIKNEISEIKYDPSNVDNKRFSLIMNDGNNVILTLDTFEKINGYDNIMMHIDCKRAKLELDFGDYVECK